MNLPIDSGMPPQISRPTQDTHTEGTGTLDGKTLEILNPTERLLARLSPGMLEHIGSGSPEAIEFSAIDADAAVSGNIFTRGGIRRRAHADKYTEKMASLPRKVFSEERDMSFGRMHAELVKLRLQITKDPFLDKRSRRELLDKLSQTEAAFANDPEIANVRLDALAQPYRDRLNDLADELTGRQPSSPSFRELQARLDAILHDIETSPQLSGSDQSTALYETVSTVQRELLIRSSDNYAPVSEGLAAIRTEVLTATGDVSEETSLIELKELKGMLQADLQGITQTIDKDKLADPEQYLLHQDTARTRGLIEALGRTIIARGIMAHAGTPGSPLARAEMELGELSENVAGFKKDQNARPPFVFANGTKGGPVRCGDAIKVADGSVAMVQAHLGNIERSNLPGIRRDIDGLRESLSAPAAADGPVDARLSHLEIVLTRIGTVADRIENNLLSGNRPLLGGELSLIRSRTESDIETLRCEEILARAGCPGTTLSNLARELSAMDDSPAARSALARLGQTSSTNLESIRADLLKIEEEAETALPQTFPSLRTRLDIIALRGERNLLPADLDRFQAALSRTRADFLPKLRGAVIHEHIPALEGVLDRLPESSLRELDTLSEQGYLLNSAFAKRVQELVTAGEDTPEAVTARAVDFFETMGKARAQKQSVADETVLQKAMEFIDTMTRDHGHLDELALCLKLELMPGEKHDDITMRHHANIAKREFGNALRQASGFRSDPGGFDMPIQEITFDSAFLHSLITNPDARLDDVNVMFARAYMLEAIADGRLAPEDGASREDFARSLATAGFPASFEALDQMIKLDFRSTRDAARVSADIEKFSRTVSTDEKALKAFLHVCHGAQKFKARETIDILARNMLHTFSISGEQAVEDGLLAKGFDKRLGIGKDPRYQRLTRNLNTFLERDQATREKFTELMSLYTRIDETQQPHMQDLLRRSADLAEVAQAGIPGDGTIPQTPLKGTTLCKSLLQICQALDDGMENHGLQQLRVETLLDELQRHISLEEMRGSKINSRTQGETTREFLRLASELKKTDLPPDEYRQAWSDMRQLLTDHRTRQKAEAVIYFKGHETSDCRFSWLQGQGAALVRQTQQIAEQISDMEHSLDRGTAKDLRTLGWSIPRVIDNAVHIAVLNQFLKSGCETLSDFKSRFVLSDSGALSPSPDYQEIRESLESMNIPFEVLAENRLNLFIHTMDDATIDKLRSGVRLDRSMRRMEKAILDETPDEIKKAMRDRQWEEAANAGIARLTPGKRMSISLGRQIDISTGDIPVGPGDATLNLAFKTARSQSVSILQADAEEYRVILKGGISAGATASLDGLLDRISVEAGVAGGIDRGCIIKFNSAEQCRELVAKLMGGRAGLDALAGSSGISFIRDGHIEAAVKIGFEPIDKSVPPIPEIGLDNGIALAAEASLGAAGQWHEERSASTVIRTHETTYTADLEVQAGTGKTGLTAGITKGSTLVYRSGALTAESSVSRTAQLGAHPDAAAFAFLQRNGIALSQGHAYTRAIMASARAAGPDAKMEVFRRLTEDAMLRYNEAASDRDRSAVLSDSSSFMPDEVKITSSRTESAFETGINLTMLKCSSTVHSDLETVVSFDLREFAHTA